VRVAAVPVSESAAIFDAVRLSQRAGASTPSSASPAGPAPPEGRAQSAGYDSQ